MNTASPRSTLAAMPMAKLWAARSVRSRQTRGSKVRAVAWSTVRMVFLFGLPAGRGPGFSLLNASEMASRCREKGRAGEESWQKKGSGRGIPWHRVPRTLQVRYSRPSLEQLAAVTDMSRRIAIVEDEPAIRGNYVDVLRKQGYEVAAYANRADALAAFRTRLPDLAVVDIGLGDDIDGGFALCRELRAMSATVPIIFLSARDSDFDIVAGLRLGADDYLTKDVSLPHLLARIAALFRRAELAAQPQAAEERLERGALHLDLKRFSVTWRGTAVTLTLTEFWMVHALCKFPEHVKSREQLMREANLVVDEGTIPSHVKRIRRKFLAADARFDAIDTVYGMGYRWKS